MPRSRRRFERSVDNLFHRHTINWDHDITRLNHIAATMGAQLAAVGVVSLMDFVRYICIDCGHIRDAARKMAQVLVTPRLHECAGAQANYLPRIFNRFAFNSLADLLDYAVQQRNQGHLFAPAVRNQLRLYHTQRHPHDSVYAWLFEYNEHNGDNVRPGPARAARSCPCSVSANTCNAQPQCRWLKATHKQPAGCVARALSDPDGENTDLAQRSMVEGEYVAAINKNAANMRNKADGLAAGGFRSIQKVRNQPRRGTAAN